MVQKINIRRSFGSLEISDKIPVDWWRFRLNQASLTFTVDIPRKFERLKNDFESLKSLGMSTVRLGPAAFDW